jgi:hypothetical protein
MPVGLVLILVGCLLRDVPTSTTPAAAVTVIAALVVAGVYWWRSNAFLSVSPAEPGSTIPWRASGFKHATPVSVRTPDRLRCSC